LVKTGQGHSEESNDPPPQEEPARQVKVRIEAFINRRVDDEPIIGIGISIGGDAIGDGIAVKTSNPNYINKDAGILLGILRTIEETNSKDSLKIETGSENIANSLTKKAINLEQRGFTHLRNGPLLETTLRA
jgi:hypothetical protein